MNQSKDSGGHGLQCSSHILNSEILEEFLLCYKFHISCILFHLSFFFSFNLMQFLFLYYLNYFNYFPLYSNFMKDFPVLINFNHLLNLKFVVTNKDLYPSRLLLYSFVFLIDFSVYFLLFIFLKKLKCFYLILFGV